MSNKNYLFSCEIKHRVRGRIRIKLRALKYLGEWKEEVENQLMQVQYIEKVQISEITGSIVIYFEDITLTDQNLISLLQNTLNAYLVEIYKNEKIDRKSTRLDSSHANISYAVFCLKKKTTKDRYY